MKDSQVFTAALMAALGVALILMPADPSIGLMVRGLIGAFMVALGVAAFGRLR